MKKINEAEELAIKTINLLEVKLNEVKDMIRSHSTYEEEKKLDRVKVAIKHSIEAIRRANMDDDIPKVIRWI